MSDEYQKSLFALVDAIESRYEHESQRKRENAFGGKIEVALTEAKKLLRYQRQESELELQLRKAKEELSALKRTQQ